jgi:hypothetical protein
MTITKLITNQVHLKRNAMNRTMLSYTIVALFLLTPLPVSLLNVATAGLNPDLFDNTKVREMFDLGWHIPDSLTAGRHYLADTCAEANQFAREVQLNPGQMITLPVPTRQS